MDAHTQATPRERQFGPFLLALVPVLLAGVFDLATLRHGHRWGDDFALYLCHARNIAEGRDYHDTGYIYDSSVASLSPRIYPPVFPLMLAPVYKWFGLNLTAMKVIIVAVFLGFLGICWWGFRNGFRPFTLTVLMALLSFHPYFWRFKENILSDVPFLFWTYLWLFTVDRVPARGPVPIGRVLRDGLAVGVLLYLAYGTRSVGLVLVPCLWLADLLRGRKIRRMTIAATLVFGLLLVMQVRLMGSSDASYLEQFTGNPVAVVHHNLTAYAEAFFDFWKDDLPKAFRAVLFGTLGLLALRGYTMRLRAGIRIFEIFVPLYTATIVVWPSFQGGRFLLPLLPLFLFYTFIGLERLGQQLPGRVRRVALAALLMLLGVHYAAGYVGVEYGPLPEGIEKPETHACFAYIREQTDPQSVFVFCKPRALALFTGRRASGYHRPRNEEELWDYLLRIQATHVVVGFARNEDFDMDGYFLLPFVEKHRECFREVFTNRDFRVFRLLAAPAGRNRLLGRRPDRASGQQPGTPTRAPG